MQGCLDRTWPDGAAWKLLRHSNRPSGSDRIPAAELLTFAALLKLRGRIQSAYDVGGGVAWVAPDAHPVRFADPLRGGAVAERLLRPCGCYVYEKKNYRSC